jgi:hypothetical protein
MHEPPGSLRDKGELAHEPPSVFVVEKDTAAGVSASYHVLDRAGRFESRLPRHENRLEHQWRQRQMAVCARSSGATQKTGSG